MRIEPWPPPAIPSGIAVRPGPPQEPVYGGGDAKPGSIAWRPRSPRPGSGRPSQIARQVPAGMREAGTCPRPSPPGRYPAASASRTHDHVERCLQCLRVRYWLQFRFRFRRRQRSRLRPAFRRRRQRHWRRHWWRLHRFGPRRLRLHGFTGTICAHPVMIPSRALCPPRGGRPVSTSCALTCACLRARPGRSIPRRHAGTPSGQVFQSNHGRATPGLVVLSAGVHERAPVGAGAGDRVVDAM